jgi:hypothetical protein
MYVSQRSFATQPASNLTNPVISVICFHPLYFKNIKITKLTITNLMAHSSGVQIAFPRYKK